MLHGEGNEKGKNNNNNNKTKQNKTIGLKQKKKHFRLQHTFFFTFFAVVFDYYNVKVPILVTRFIEEMSHE